MSNEGMRAIRHNFVVWHHPTLCYKVSEGSGAASLYEFLSIIG